MSAPDLLSLSMSSDTIERRMSGVTMLLAEGSRCVYAPSKRGARRNARDAAIRARDLLDALIEALSDGAAS
jgi:hypothetical protein